MAKAKSKTIYDVHPGIAMIVKWVADLKEKTGRSVEEWVALVKKEGPTDPSQGRTYVLNHRHCVHSNGQLWLDLLFYSG